MDSFLIEDSPKRAVCYLKMSVNLFVDLVPLVCVLVRKDCDKLVPVKVSLALVSSRILANITSSISEVSSSKLPESDKP